MTNRLTLALQDLIDFCIDRRWLVTTLLGLVTAFTAYQAMHVLIRTELEDLLPKSHPYIAVHEKFKQDFGGSNVVSIMLEVQQGDIFTQEVLGKVRTMTRELQQVDAVNQFQIISLASKKMRDIRGSTTSMDFKPLMWPDLPEDEAAMSRLREAVLTNPLAYGSYVSRDLKAALITIDFHDHLVDFGKVFSQVLGIVENARGEGLTISLVGTPILFGWVSYYLHETLLIFMATVALLIVLLFVTARTWRGTLLPLLAGSVSAVWALGFARLIGYNVDPLVIVIAFLITARAISHSVQLVTRFDDELAAGAVDAIAAAKAAMLHLFKPGMLGVIADAGCMLVVLLTPIPLMQKVSVIGTVWVLTIALSACVLTPVLLSWVKRPSRKVESESQGLNKALQGVLTFCTRLTTSRFSRWILLGTSAVFVVSAFYAFNLTVGDARPGSPILRADSEFNRDAAAINTKFQGSDRMFVVFGGNKEGALKDPEVLRDLSRFQRYMGAQPEIGGSLSIADVFPLVQKTLREGNPRYQDVGRSSEENGELAFMLLNGSEPGDLARYADPKLQYGSVTLFFRDLQGQTLRTAIARVKEYAQQFPLAQGSYLLAGGMGGVLGAVNEVLLSGQIESIALALLVLLVCCAVAYRSTVAGIFFMVPVVLSNTLTFSYMAAMDIGMNINTVPVAALGIGLGVDYAFYIVDSIRENMGKTLGPVSQAQLAAAIAKAMNTAGRGVLITASALIVSVVLWSLSSLRFQAEMGVLMAIWLFVSSASALLLVPAMVFVFRPAFVLGQELTRPEELPSASVQASLPQGRSAPIAP